MLMQLSPRHMAFLAAVLWSLSFFLGLHFFPAAALERLLATLCGTAGLGFLVAAGGGLHERVVAAPRIALCVVLLWVFAVCSMAWSVAPSLTLVYIEDLTLMAATIVAVLAARADVRFDFLRALAWLTGGVIAGICLWALVQVFIMPGFLVNGQVRHPFPNPNAYAALLGLSSFAALGLYLNTDALRPRRALWGLLFLIFCAFAAIAGKAATLGLATGLVLLLLIGGTVFLPLRWKSLLCLAGSVLAVALVMAMLPYKTDAASAVFGMLTGQTGTIENRIDIWRSALQLVAAHPWLGTGYRSFALMYPSVRLPDDIYSSGMMVHMDPLQLWVELGILGPVFYYAIALGAAWRFLRFWRSGAATPRQRVFVLSLFLGCAAFFAHSHVDFLLYTFPVMLVFAAVFATLLSVCAVESEKPATPFSFMAGWPDNVRFFALFVPVLAVTLMNAPMMAGEHYIARATQKLEAQDFEGFAAAVNTANRVDMGWGARSYVLATTIPMGILRARMPLIPPDEQRALLAQIDSLTAKALARNSRMATAWVLRGETLRLLSPGIVPKDHISAEDAFKNALAIDPLHLSARLSLAQIYRETGREDDEYKILMDGVGWPYPRTDPAALYSRAEELARSRGEEPLAIIKKFRDLHHARVGDARDRKSGREQALRRLLLVP